MKVEKKIEKLIELREEILTDAKNWKGDVCPLNIDKDWKINHYTLSRIFTGLGNWGWKCPFCKEEFQE